MVFICVLGGIGTAGVPAGSIPVVVMILGMVGVPAEGIGMILGVDRFLDMCRTTLNVTGDLAAAVVVSKGEPHLVSRRRRDLTVATRPRHRRAVGLGERSAGATSSGSIGTRDASPDSLNRRWARTSAPEVSVTQ